VRSSGGSRAGSAPNRTIRLFCRPASGGERRTGWLGFFSGRRHLRACPLTPRRFEKGGAVADPANLVLLCVGHHRMAEPSEEVGGEERVDEKPKRPERHVTTTWRSFEEYRRDRPAGAVRVLVGSRGGISRSRQGLTAATW